MIGNTAEIIVYNRTGTADIDTETVWFGHKITGVRVEYDDGTTNTGTGTEGGAVTTNYWNGSTSHTTLSCS